MTDIRVGKFPPHTRIGPFEGHSPVRFAQIDVQSAKGLNELLNLVKNSPKERPLSDFEIGPASLQDVTDEGEEPGYWSMEIHKLNSNIVQKALTALRLMMAHRPLNCLYIDGPDFYARFDMRKRQMLARPRNEIELEPIGRAIFNAPHRTLRINEEGLPAVQDRVPVSVTALAVALRPPEVSEGLWNDVLPTEISVPFSSNDPDALIVPDSLFGKVRSEEEIEKDIAILKKELLRITVSSWRNINIHVKRSRNEILMSYNCSKDELRARELLCEMIGEVAYRRYLKSGRLTVKGDSGKLYVIEGGHSHVHCLEAKNGRYYHRESLCIQFLDKMTHTDSVIMRMVLLQNNENEFRSLSNITPNLWPDEIEDRRRVAV